jgi:Kdo2-lipid IVA lauroyltransferase/acyltransferase
VVHLREFGESLSSDPQLAAAQVNAAMERLIRECPEQYLWGYGRYKSPRQQSAAPSTGEGA